MGFWIKTKEEKETIIEKGTQYTGFSTENIGPICKNDLVTIKMLPDLQKIELSSKGNKIELPYDRLIGFSIEDEAKLTSGKISIGGAVIGGALLGPAGAVVGALSKKGKNKINWIGTLVYADKNGERKELCFLTNTLGNPNKKTFVMTQFETAMNNIATRKYNNEPFEL